MAQNTSANLTWAKLKAMAHSTTSTKMSMKVSLKMVKQTVKVLILIKTVLSTKEVGKTTSRMAMALRDGLMVLCTQVISKWGRNMVSVSTTGLTDQSMRVHGL